MEGGGFHYVPKARCVKIVSNIVTLEYKEEFPGGITRICRVTYSSEDAAQQAIDQYWKTGDFPKDTNESKEPNRIPAN